MMTNDNVKIAKLEVQMANNSQQLNRVEVKVDRLLERFETTASSFVTKKELQDIVKQFDEDIRAARNFNWLTHSMTAILTAVIVAIAYWVVGGLHK